MVDNLIEGAAVAVPGLFLGWRIWTGNRSDRALKMNWALFAVPILVWGLLKRDPIDLAGAALVGVGPYAIDRAFDQVFPRRRR